MSLEDAYKLRELKERTGLRYMMAETSYYRQPNIYARNLFEQGGFGELYYSELEYYHDRGDLDALVTDKTSRFYEPDGSRSWRWGLPPMRSLRWKSPALSARLKAPWALRFMR